MEQNGKNDLTCESEEQQNEENEKEDIVTLEDMAEMENEARRLLGGQNPDLCTYPQGYTPRQALYSCRTCTPSGNAGVCFGCSLNCHDGHDLVELYTKRRFKCDCGNSKFTQKCSLFEEEKSQVNERNEYNHNFVNEYCVCNRPHPDPEGKSHEEMAQCVACEDWFHPSHIGLTHTPELDNNEMICLRCVERFPFFEKVSISRSEEEKNCIKMERDEESSPMSHLLSMNWREKICDCEKCKDLCDGLGCDWIHDIDDSLQKYEEESREKMKKEDVETENALNRLIQNEDRDVVVEVISEMNKMKRRLAELINTVSEGGENVVTERHIQLVFEQLKRERNEERQRRLEQMEEQGKHPAHLDGEY